ncbi:hypothetical protein CR513_08865, partial [Mucuna pruriens]
MVFALDNAEISAEEVGHEAETDPVDATFSRIRRGNQRQKRCREFSSGPPELIGERSRSETKSQMNRYCS